MYLFADGGMYPSDGIRSNIEAVAKQEMEDMCYEVCNLVFTVVCGTIIVITPSCGDVYGHLVCPKTVPTGEPVFKRLSGCLQVA